MEQYITNEEVWKPVAEEGFEEFYEVSNFGRIRSVDRVVESKRGPLNYKGRIISTSLNDDGYPSFNFCYAGKKKNVKVHQVVAKVFIPNPNNHPEVNHKDEVKTNNHVDNLEWCTREYNMRYGTGLERMKNHPNQKKRYTESKVPIIGVKINDESIMRFESISEAGRNGFKRRNLWSALNGSDASHKGYVWCYEDKYSSDRVKELLNRVRIKRVAHIDDEGNVIKILGTVKEAAKIIGVDNGRISRVCTGKHNHAKGYKLKYIE